VLANTTEQIDSLLNASSQIYPSDPTLSFEICLKAEKLAIKSNDHQFDGDISYYKARYYVLTAKYDLASIEIVKAIDCYTEVNNLIGISSTYGVKSIMFQRTGDLKGSHALLVKAMRLQKDAGDTGGYIQSLANISLNYKQTGQLDSMRQCLIELDQFESSLRPPENYYRLQNWGIYFNEMKEYDSAIFKYDQARIIVEQLNFTDSKATLLSLLAQSHRLNGQVKIAEQLGIEGYEYAVKNNLIYESSENLVEVIAALANQKKFADAFIWQSKLAKVEKEIYDLEKVQKVKQVEAQLKVAEHDKLIAQSEANLKASELQGEQARTRNAWMYAIVFIVCILLFFIIFIYIKTKRLNTTIQQQKLEVEHKSQNLEEALSNIHDSLEYSKLIQNAMLPGPEVFDANFIDSFVLYRPKDIVSGDFYWIHKSEDVTIIAVGDCTGHGVPGAMVSMVCHEALNKVIKEQGELIPGRILDGVRDFVANSFKNSNDNLNDGMDIALCAIKNNVISFSGAHSPIWILRDHEILVTKGDKQPIGKFEKSSPFSTHEIPLQQHDQLYLFSDGYADQFGGEKGKKLKSANMKKLLTSLKDESMKEQGDSLGKIFDQWKGDLEQIDDVCVIGVKL